MEVTEPTATKVGASASAKMASMARLKGNDMGLFGPMAGNFQNQIQFLYLIKTYKCINIYIYIYIDINININPFLLLLNPPNT